MGLPGKQNQKLPGCLQLFSAWRPIISDKVMSTVDRLGRWELQDGRQDYYQSPTELWVNLC